MKPENYRTAFFISLGIAVAAVVIGVGWYAFMPNMSGWTYKTEDVELRQPLSGEMTVYQLIQQRKTLDAMGAEGWELTGVAALPPRRYDGSNVTRHRLLFKRPARKTGPVPVEPYDEESSSRAIEAEIKAEHAAFEESLKRFK